MNGRNTPWSFLEKVKRISAPLNHLTLVEACCRNLEVLEHLAQTVKEMVATNTSNKTTLSFYAVTLTQVVSSNVLEDNFLTRLLPFLFCGLKSDNLDYKLASYMIISQITVITTLTSSVLDSFIDSILCHLVEPILSEALLCVAFLCQTQKIYSIKPETLNHLISYDNLVPVLRSFIESKYSIRNLLQVLIYSLADHWYVFFS